MFYPQIRNDTSQIVNENLPQIQQKSDEMRQIYRRIDKLEVNDHFTFASLLPHYKTFSLVFLSCFLDPVNGILSPKQIQGF